MPWNMANWKWSECQFVSDLLGEIQIRPGVPGELAVPPWLREEEPYNPYDRDKKKRFIRLLAKVKGHPEFDQQTEVRDDIRVTIDDVALVIKKVSGIDITAKTEE